MDFNPSTGPIANSNYPVHTTKNIDFLVAKHVNVIRFLFSWEGMQSVLLGPVPASQTGNYKTYFDNYKNIVDYATSKGIVVIIEPWDSDSSGGAGGARYRGVIPTPTQFQDFWQKMAAQFKSNPLVNFGLINEPNSMSTMQWWTLAQAAVTGIRASGATQRILIPGNGWTGASTWTSNWYDSSSPQRSNAYGILNANGVGKPLTDPLNNYAVEVHTYLDANEGGGATDISSVTAARQHLNVIVTEAKTHGYKVFLGEIGFWAGNPIASQAWADFISYSKTQPSLIGWSWWACGAPGWWGDVGANGGGHFSITPTNGTTFTGDTVNMSMIQGAF